MARENDQFGVGPTLLTIAAGYSLALWVRAQPGEVGSDLKYFTGGSLEIMQVATPGQSGIAQTAAGQGYLMGTTEKQSFSGPASYYLCATGATTQAYLLRKMGTGY